MEMQMMNQPYPTYDETALQNLPTVNMTGPAPNVFILCN